MLSPVPIYDTTGFSRVVPQFQPSPEYDRSLDTTGFSRVVSQFQPSSEHDSFSRHHRL